MMKNIKIWMIRFDFCMTKTQITLNMRNRLGCLGRGTTLWEFLNQLISIYLLSKVAELDLLYFSNWSAWWLIFLTNKFLTPKLSAPYLNIRRRKTLDVLINCAIEEDTTALMVVENIFDGKVLLLYGNLTTLKL